jgi:glycosyltransferase involved in cell wall biosynthesis
MPHRRVADIPRRLIYHSPITTGGLATYAHYQCNALSAIGCHITLVTSADYAATDADYEVVRLHPARSTGPAGLPHWARRVATLQDLLGQQRRFAEYVEQQGRATVLMGAYFEYAAPLWAGMYRSLAGDGSTFGAIVHDPVRDYVVGPSFWHRKSVAAAYSFLREAFVHAPIALDTAGAPAPRTTVIPHGPYRYPAPRRSRAATRAALQIPPDAFVLLSFGHLRDGKNLDLAIEALTQSPAAHLLVAGTVPSGANRPLSYYQQLAVEKQVADRCHWRIGYIEDAEVGELFEASDAVLLTYSARFRSASGVLNTAVSFRKPCLASSGEGDLKAAVENYRLGPWVAPDDAAAAARGLRALLSDPPAPAWDDYEREHSWIANARLVADRMFTS